MNTTKADANSGRGVGRNGGGYGLFGKKVGTTSAPYHPTVIALMVLIIAEFAAYCALRYAFKTVHGG